MVDMNKKIEINGDIDQSQKKFSGSDVGVEATQAHIKNYVTGLIISTTAPYMRVPDLDLGNSLQVFIAASQGLQDKQTVNSAKISYDVINSKLTALIKIHMNQAENSFTNKLCHFKDPNTSSCLGDLRYINPKIYLKSTDTSHTDSGRPISPSDKTLSYKFFMVRDIVGDHARKLEPDWIVTFSEKKSVMYDKHDLLDSFEYVDSKSGPIKGHNGKRFNQEAVKILKASKSEVIKAIENTFEEYIYDCNQLKETTELHHQVNVCQGKSDTWDPDYFLELLTCLEIFNLATTVGYCKDLKYDDDIHLDF
jgi:hypothetical protein